MFHIVLLEPEIPQNTGNIIRLCANSGANLHLVRPLGFRLDDRKLKRAGLDYHEWARLTIHDSLKNFMAQFPQSNCHGFSTRGMNRYHTVRYQPGDSFIFGPETRGLPDPVFETLGHRNILRIPMQAHSRSLNLSNAVAVVLYEAWRQQNFHEGT